MENKEIKTIQKKPIRLIELFAGVGSQAMALRNIGVDFSHHAVVEFDSSALNSYNAIHGTCFSPTDIRKVKGADLNITDSDKYTYIMTYSFPCQDLSCAGLQKGMKKGTDTRSGLLWEVERIFKELKESGDNKLPQVLLMENVPMVHGKKNIKDFNEWIDFLSSIGYISTWRDLNSKNYGIPQNRNRCFMVSLLNGRHFMFPAKKPLNFSSVDFLEDEVPEEFYLKDERAASLIKEYEKAHNDNMICGEKKLQSYNMTRQGIVNKTDIVSALTATRYKRGFGGNIDAGTVVMEKRSVIAASRGRNPDNPSNRIPGLETRQRLEINNEGLCNALTSVQKDNLVIEQIGNICSPNKKSNPIYGRVYAPNSLAPTIRTPTGGYTMPLYIVFEKYSYKNKAFQIQADESIATLRAKDSGGHKKVLVEDKGKYRIRSLTPRECWRFMGFTDEDFDKAATVNNKTHLYMQAGNSIVVQVLEAIFIEIIKQL